MAVTSPLPVNRTVLAQVIMLPVSDNLVDFKLFLCFISRYRTGHSVYCTVFWIVPAYLKGIVLCQARLDNFIYMSPFVACLNHTEVRCR